jgi:hypothetical protein
MPGLPFVGEIFNGHVPHKLTPHPRQGEAMSATDLWAHEEQFWTAGADYYREHLAAESLMVFPPPTGPLNRARTIAAVADAPRWKSVSLANRRLVRPADHTAVLAYAVTADRGDGASRYQALCSSTYVRLPDGWKLVLHQQTPIPS